MRTILHRTMLLAATLLPLLPGSSASAQHYLFNWDIEVDDGSDSATGLARTNDLRRLTDQIDTSNLRVLFDRIDFTDPDAVSIDADLNLRGVPATVRFDAGTNELQVDFPFMDEEIRFAGGDRGESLEQFESWLQGKGRPDSIQNAALTRVLQELVAKSPVDPIAGNPNSLQSKMFEAAFWTGTTGDFRPEPGTPEAEEWTGKDHFRASGRYERFSGGPWDGNVWEAGIDYQLNLQNPKWALLFDLPVIVTQTEGSESYLISAGLGVMFRPTHWWNITPSVRFGGGGSFKLGAVALMPSVDVTSSMRWNIGSKEHSIGGRKFSTTDFELGLGNMFGWGGTFDDLEIAGIRVAYDLNNYALRNGVDVTKRLPLRMLGGQTAVKLFFVDTWILGSQLFLDHYNEIGLQIGTQRETGGKWRDSLSFHTAYVFGKGYDAVQLRLSMRF